MLVVMLLLLLSLLVSLVVLLEIMSPLVRLPIFTFFKLRLSLPLSLSP